MEEEDDINILTAAVRADTIRAQSQRRSNVELANEIDSAPQREKEAEKSFDEVEELFSVPKKVKSRVSNNAPTQRMDRLLHRAMVPTQLMLLGKPHNMSSTGGNSRSTHANHFQRSQHAGECERVKLSDK